MIRPATLADLPALTALEQELFGVDAWSEDLIRQEIEGPGRRFLVSDDLAGYAVTMSAGDIVDLLRIGVRPQARRRGLASQLLDEVRILAADTLPTPPTSATSASGRTYPSTNIAEYIC